MRLLQDFQPLVFAYLCEQIWSLRACNLILLFAAHSFTAIIVVSVKFEGPCVKSLYQKQPICGCWTLKVLNTSGAMVGHNWE